MSNSVRRICAPGDAAWKQQVAALCRRRTRQGNRYLLITSRETGRWVLPKGWPISGLMDHEAALQEAWEEAGVREATVTRQPIGSFFYGKVLKGGDVAPVRAEVYLADVKALAPRYPEHAERRRQWFSLRDAAKRVAEPTLRQLLRRVPA